MSNRYVSADCHEMCLHGQDESKSEQVPVMYTVTLVTDTQPQQCQGSGQMFGSMLSKQGCSKLAMMTWPASSGQKLKAATALLDAPSARMHRILLCMHGQSHIYIQHFTMTAASVCNGILWDVYMDSSADTQARRAPAVRSQAASAPHCKAQLGNA